MSLLSSVGRGYPVHVHRSPVNNNAARGWDGNRDLELWVASAPMFKRRREIWAKAALLLGAHLEPGGAMQGELGGYSFIASAPKEIMLGSAAPSMVCRVELPELPGGVSVVPEKARMRNWLPFRGRFVVFDDPAWDRVYAVRADDREQAANYLSENRRRVVMEATGAEGKSWFEPAEILWRLDPKIHGLEVHLVSMPLTPEQIAKGVQATVALAQVLDPKR